MTRTMDQIREDQNRRHRLNVEVAQRVLGLTTDWGEMRLRPNGPDSEEMLLRIPMEVWSDTGAQTVLTDYSGDIGAAWEIVETMQERGWWVQITSHQGYPDPWECLLWRAGPRHTEVAEANSPAEAICRAALLAVEWDAIRQTPH